MINNTVNTVVRYFFSVSFTIISFDGIAYRGSRSVLFYDNASWSTRHQFILQGRSVFRRRTHPMPVRTFPSVHSHPLNFDQP